MDSAVAAEQKELDAMTDQIAALTHLPHAAPHDTHKPVARAAPHAKMAAAAAAPMVVKKKVAKRRERIKGGRGEGRKEGRKG